MNFNKVLDKLDPTLNKRPTACYCTKCRGDGPRPAVTGDWRSRFRRNGWDPFVAMERLGLRHEENPICDEEGQPPDDGSEGRTSYDSIWLRHDGYTPVRTAAHELAHALLGHSARRVSLMEQAMESGDVGDQKLAFMTGLALSEQEAETVAALVVVALGGEDEDDVVERSRSYINGYLPPVKHRFRADFGYDPDRRARLIATANRILSAGQVDDLACAA